MTRDLIVKAVLIFIFCGAVAFTGGLFAQDDESEKEYDININQIAFIVKYDKNKDGKVDNEEFTGIHFSSMDLNGDGFIEPHEAPAGETAY